MIKETQMKLGHVEISFNYDVIRPFYTNRILINIVSIKFVRHTYVESKQASNKRGFKLINDRETDRHKQKLFIDVSTSITAFQTED